MNVVYSADVEDSARAIVYSRGAKHTITFFALIYTDDDAIYLLPAQTDYFLSIAMIL